MSFLSARRDAGLSQAFVAEKLGISPASVSQWETGKTKPNTDRLLEIAELYDHHLHGDVILFRHAA